MQNSERISGQRLFHLFDYLQKRRTILKINLLGRDYEGLTNVTGLETHNNIRYFLIDYPGGSREIFQPAEGSKVIFEFSGEDKLQHTFKSVIGKVAEDDIWIKFPEAIERIQRRNHFRVSPPIGSKVYHKIDNRRYEFNVLNVSHAGALINQDASYHRKSLFYVGGYLNRILLVCNEDYAKVRVEIKRSEINRIEQNVTTGKYQYALQFLDIEKNMEDKLKAYIYHCQREVLRRRSFLTKV